MLVPMPKQTTVRDAKYLRWLRTLPCVCCGATENVQAHHEGSRGMGLKASDLTAICLCFRCHRERHDKGAATFWGDTGPKEVITRLNAAYELSRGKKGE